MPQIPTNEIHIDMGVLIRETDEQYRQKANEFLTSHQLAEFRRCPLLYQRRKAGLVPDEDRPAYLVGRAAHVRILEGQEKYKADFAIGGPINPSTGRPFGAGTKAYAEWAHAQGKPVLTDDQAALIEELAAGVGANPEAVDLIVEGVAEGVVRAEYGVPSQIRLDWLNPHRGIVDLKTCDDLTWFEADAKRYGYVYQMAFYRAVLARAINQLVPVHIIAVEKKEPFRCGVWRIGDDMLAIAQKENEAAIQRLKRCQERDLWPTGYESVRVLNT